MFEECEKKNGRLSWNTDDERRFLKYAGVWSGASGVSEHFARQVLRCEVVGFRARQFLQRRIRVLEGYLNADRQDWGGINQKVVMNYAKNELAAAKKILGVRE